MLSYNLSILVDLFELLLIVQSHSRTFRLPLLTVSRRRPWAISTPTCMHARTSACSCACSHQLLHSFNVGMDGDKGFLVNALLVSNKFHDLYRSC